MQIKKRSNGYYYLIYWCKEAKNNKKISLGTKDFNEANEEALYFLSNIVHRTAEDYVFVKDVIDLYIREYLHNKDISDYNRETYTGRLSYVSQVLGDVLVDRLDQSDIDRFCKIKDDVTSGTQRTYLSQLVAALNFAKKKGRIQSVPALDLPAHNPPAQRWLSNKEIDLIRRVGRSMRTNALKPCRAEVFFEIGLYTGQRKAAITSLTWDRVDLERKLIDFRYRKVQTTKKSGMVPMHPKLHEFLCKLALDPDRNAYVCYNDGDIRKTFETMTTKAKLPGVTPKTLRHTTASIMMSASVSADIIANILGNTPQMIVKVYGHLDPKAVSGALSALDNLDL